MRENKVSLVEKKVLRIFTIFVLVQLIIAFIFICMLAESQQINVDDIKQIDITIDDVYYFRVPRNNWLFIVSDSSKYLFKNRSTSEEYSVSELYEAISEGSELSLIYQEKDTIFGKTNLIVDARTKTEVYRTLEEYNRAKQGLPLIVIIFFSIIEVIFVGIFAVYVWINFNVFKEIYRRIKKYHK